MPGYLGGSGSSGGGVGGEIKFPKEFIDPVTKLRVSNPENLIDTDFEYGLQPTKWETVELINNTPSFFSKSGDTTIDGIRSITTNSGTREITIRTELEHGLAVGIPINVQGTKSVTADGAYIINSIPDEFTFTYLAKDVQETTASIEDLYSSVITGEFFQGSQLRINSIVTDGASPISELTVTTEATHGFGNRTPFYFLNLNSTIAQEFPASNTETRSFDSSNSATAQTFDGSNTLSSINIDFSNSATTGGFPSSIATTSVESDTITVNHPAEENFVGLPLGQALYYNVAAGSGYFAANPRGVVFLKTTNQLSTSQSVFQVSEIPEGDPINITGAMSGTFQIANQARTFPGNNSNILTEVNLNITDDAPLVFDGANENGNVVVNPQFDGTNSFIVTSQSGIADVNWPFNTMIFFETDGTPPTGLSDETTYFINQAFQIGSTNQYSVRISEFPNQGPISISNDGTGTMTFTEIGVSPDKDIIHINNHNLQPFDMVKYTYPEGGRFVADQIQDFYFVQTVYDANNFSLTHTLGEVTPEFQSFGPFDAGTQSITSEVNIVGFEAPYTFLVTSGVLPEGLTLNASTGVISGTPTAVYDGQVVVTLTDANGSQDTQTISFEFTQPPFLYDFSSVTFTPGGQSGSTGPSLTETRNGAGNPSWGNEYITAGEFTGYFRWTVPQSATYRITAAGGRGGWHPSYRRGGYGARMRGDFNLEQGEVLQMVVGQQGVVRSSNSVSGGPNYGGGGGTFVWKNADTSLLIAAGGGGGVSAQNNSNNSTNRANGTTSTSGQSGSNSSGNTGTSGGNNGNRGTSSNYSRSAGPGGGWNSGGRFDPGNNCSYVVEGGAGRTGGFLGGRGGSNWSGNLCNGRGNCEDMAGRFGGGGGATGACGTSGSGGAGGYSGGGTGNDCCASAGGGGGSFNSGANPSNSSGNNNGDGYITIEKL